MSDEKNTADSLDLQGVIGFNGTIPKGLILHPDDEHMIYPLGSTIVMKHLTNNTQHFLQKNGHDRSVSCLALSRSGRFLASGQITHMGFPATVIIWNLETCEAIHKLKLHKGKVEDLAFSPSENYLATMGGQDDNKIVIWDVSTGEAICGSPAANDMATCITYLNNDDNSFVTAGKYNLRVWSFDRPNRKIRPADCNLGHLKRVFTSVVIDDQDEFMYCGTNTGDLLQISLSQKLFKMLGPEKKPFGLGITSVSKSKKGNIIVGCGDGTVAVMNKENLKVVKRMSVAGSVTSLQLNAAGDHFFVATAECNTYLVQLATFDHELRNTCHKARINDVAFAANYSELFATCSLNDIRVWHARTRNELLRIQVPNFECLCVGFSHDGKSIISGWDDGKIRAFRPQSGKLMYTINDAHNGGVTALASTKNSQVIISGGKDGQVRVWEIGKKTQRMVASMKEHKASVNNICLNSDDSECLTASADGSCIAWSLERFVRNSAIFASTQFRAIEYHPDQSQYLTTGTDRKITYWDAVDANPIRIMDGSGSAEVNTLAIAADGERFVSAGLDKLVKVWSYDEGFCYYQGVGHSGGVTKVKVSPDQLSIVSVGEEGAIFIWTLPHLSNHQEQQQQTTQAMSSLRINDR